MLIGAHVSTAGGLTRAAERGVERDCEAIQIFHQSSRAWRPTARSDEEIAEFRMALEESPIDAVVIHAVYLINCASMEDEIRSKSLTSLMHALRLGDRIGAAGVVLHPGSQKGCPYDDCMRLVGEALREVLAESERCRLLLEDTAGATGTLGRDFDELARLVELGGGGERLGICLDCCHLLASGFEIRTPDALGDVVDEFESKLGLERLGCLHVNDSAMPLGSNRDRHANLGEGELGRAGLRAFLSEPRFDALPALIETPGFDKRGPDTKQVRLAKRLRREGLKARGFEIR
ncbi:MAG TPA: deoxyribonuclease IV [Solirubrobacterales bacterium]|nr:deoxyribonuclease IV [Solirubrobacterales bacterium]